MKGVFSLRIVAVPLLGMALAWGLAMPASATSITGTYSNDGDSFNQATGFPNGPFDLTSVDGATYSYVDFIPDQVFTLADITSLSATFTDLAGGAEGGSPRFFVGLSDGSWLDVYLGTPPSFNDSNPAAFTAAFSGFNLVNGTNNTGFENSGSYNPFASYFTSYGSLTVTDIALVLDGSWGPNGDQELTLDSINLDANAASVPEPLTLSLFGAGLVGLGALRRRKARRAA